MRSSASSGCVCSQGSGRVHRGHQARREWKVAVRETPRRDNAGRVRRQLPPPGFWTHPTSPPGEFVLLSGGAKLDGVKGDRGSHEGTGKENAKPTTTPSTATQSPTRSCCWSNAAHSSQRRTPARRTATRERGLTEKLGSGQLFGRRARAAAGVFIDGWLEDALADPDTDGDDALRAKLVMAAATEFTVVNKVFVTKRFITAVARIGGVAYGLGRKMSDIEEDVEALVAATTGSMIETGGTNVAHLGCLPKVHSR